MGLSALQSLAIGVGKAAEVIRSSDIRKSKEYNDAFNNFIDNNVGALKKASAKQKLLEGRMKKEGTYEAFLKSIDDMLKKG